MVDIMVCHGHSLLSLSWLSSSLGLQTTEHGGSRQSEVVILIVMAVLLVVLLVVFIVIIVIVVGVASERARTLETERWP